MSDINKEIEHRVSAFVSELTSLVRQAAVDAVADVLGGRKAGPSRTVIAVKATPARRGRPPASGRHRSPEQISSTLDAIVSYIKSHPNSGSAQIRDALKLPKPVMLDSLARLRDAKKIKMKGIRRGATYSV